MLDKHPKASNQATPYKKNEQTSHDTPSGQVDAMTTKAQQNTSKTNNRHHAHRFLLHMPNLNLTTVHKLTEPCVGPDRPWDGHLSFPPAPAHARSHSARACLQRRRLAQGVFLPGWFTRASHIPAHRPCAVADGVHLASFGALMMG